MSQEYRVQLWLYCSCAAIAASAVPAFAQSQTPADAGSASAEAANSQTAADETFSGDIIVTAQRRSERLMDVPVSVQAFSSDALERAGITETQDIEQISPAVSFQAGYAPDATSLYIRGVGSLAQEGGLQPSVGVVIDNVPLARASEFLADLADVERIEVLSGPQGTLFGKNTTAGVVNIITKRPTFDTEGSLELTGTTDQEVFSRAVVNTPLSQSAALRLNAFYRYQDPLVENPSNNDVAGQKSWGGQAKLLLEFSEGTDLLLSAHRSEIDSSYGAQFVVVPISGPLGQLQQVVAGPLGYGVNRINSDTPNFNAVTNTGATAELNTDLSDSLSLVSVTAFRRFDYRTKSDINSTPVGCTIGTGCSPNPLGYPIAYISNGLSDGDTRGRYEYVSQELRLHYDRGPLSAVGGVFGQRYRERREMPWGVAFVFDGAFATGDPGQGGVRYFNQTATRADLSDDTIAIFTDVTYELSDTLKLFGGLRFTHEKIGLDYRRDNYFTLFSNFNIQTGQINASPIATLAFTSDDANRTDNSLSGRAGLQWQPNPDTNIYASYARGYKGAGANMGSTLASADVALLAPETADAVELGWKQRMFDNRLQIAASAYWQEIDNIQQSAVQPGTVSTSLINAGQLRTIGAEFNATARPSDALNLSLGVVYNDAEYKGDVLFPCGPSGGSDCFAVAGDPSGTLLRNLEGQPAIGSPKWKVVASADYEVPISTSLKMMAHANYAWRSEIQYQLFQDPLTAQDGFGIADASLGVGAQDDSWSIKAFVNNIFNRFYYGELNTADFFIGRSFGRIPRDYKRYGGVTLRYEF